MTLRTEATNHLQALRCRTTIYHRVFRGRNSSAFHEKKRACASFDINMIPMWDLYAGGTHYLFLARSCPRIPYQRARTYPEPALNIAETGTCIAGICRKPARTKLELAAVELELARTAMELQMPRRSFLMRPAAAYPEQSWNRHVYSWNRHSYSWNCDEKTRVEVVTNISTACCFFSVLTETAIDKPRILQESSSIPFLFKPRFQFCLPKSWAWLVVRIVSNVLVYPVCMSSVLPLFTGFHFRKVSPIVALFSIGIGPMKNFSKACLLDLPV